MSSFPPALENADSDIGLCGWMLVILSVLLMLVTLPISIWMCIKVSKLLKSGFISHSHLTGTIEYITDDDLLCLFNVLERELVLQTLPL